MKKLLSFIFFFILFIPIYVNASGGISVSPSNLNIELGKTINFTITANNAAGKISISSSNSAVASISNSSTFIDSQTISINVTGNSVGSSTITVYLNDVTTYDDENLNGKSYSINVTVYEKQNNTEGETVKTDTIKTTTTSQTKKSKNNALKSIEVENQSVIKVDDNNYTLVVAESVSNINIIASAQDSKAKISGTGKFDLTIGDNIFQINVISESGLKNTIKLVVTRKSNYDLEDLDLILNETSNISEIIVSNDAIITTDMLSKIKTSGKKITFIYRNDAEKNIYSWIIDGEKLDDIQDINTKVSVLYNENSDLLKASNYADGIYVNVEGERKYGNGVTLQVNINDKYKNKNELLNLYNYNSTDNSLTLIQKDYKNKLGYLEFSSKDIHDYFITMSNVNIQENNKSNSNNKKVILIVSGTIILVLCLLIIRTLIMKKF